LRSSQTRSRRNEDPNLQYALVPHAVLDCRPTWQAVAPERGEPNRLARCAANWPATQKSLHEKPLDLAKQYHIYPFHYTGRKTAGLSLMEQARVQRQMAAFSNQKASYWKSGLDCWATEQETKADADADADADVESQSDPGGMTYAAERPSGELTQWTVFPTADGLAIAYNGFAEFMRYCRADYRVVPWPQAALARRLPGQTSRQAVREAEAPATGPAQAARASGSRHNTAHMPPSSIHGAITAFT
jgi:hypothetical protein